MESLPPLVVIGTGDHARVILDALRALGERPSGFVDLDPPTSAGRHPFGLQVIGDLTVELGWRENLPDARFVVAIGNNAVRASAFSRAVALGLKPETVVHPTATLLGDTAIGAGSQICARAVVGVSARIGINSIINTAATIDHDNAIGDHVSIGPGAHLAGRVTVGAYSQVGLASSVNEGLTIGSRCVVAAGAAVIRAVPDGSRVAGVPARPMPNGDQDAQGDEA